LRILVRDEGAATLGRRLSSAAAALAMRGHEVMWEARGAASIALPDEVVRTQRGARARPDVVLGGPRHVARTVLAGRRAGAHAMVLALEPEAVARWGWPDRLAWHGLYSCGLVEPDDAEAMRRSRLGLELERLGLWSDDPPAGEPDAGHPDVEILERACERALARHRARGERPAVFLDRDGTLVVERGYLADPDQLDLLPGVPLALQNLRAAGFALVVISNQSGVGRGLFPLSSVYRAMARLRRLLRAHGVELDGIYFCPHRPDAGCPCRKPRPGLLERAAVDQRLDLRRSFMIGDKRIDAETGINAGAQGVLVRTGYGRDEERALAGEPGAPRPDAVFDDLAEAATWMVGELESASSR
jgi:histidinol-phosphate phosphatase family protein